MTMVDKIPFTDDGMTEATSRYVTAETFDDAWRRVVSETPYLSETDRAVALNAEDLIKPPGATAPGFISRRSCASSPFRAAGGIAASPVSSRIPAGRL